jgi:hypothetical protein
VFLKEGWSVKHYLHQLILFKAILNSTTLNEKPKAPNYDITYHVSMYWIKRFGYEKYL